MRQAVSRIVDRIGGLSVIEGEHVLDQARRLIWHYVFTGRAFQECARELEASPIVVDVAGLLMPEAASAARPGTDIRHSLATMFGAIETVALEVRLLGWAAAYQNDPTSAFGRHAQSCIEEADRYAAPPGSHLN